jgi:GntR family transcriptional regulator / MocR family aminotransferase
VTGRRTDAWLDALECELERSPSARYRGLADGLRAAIASGALPAGTRLPTQRELARRLSLTRTTVVSAYNLLRGERLLVARRGAGTWVGPLPSGAPPQGR